MGSHYVDNGAVTEQFDDWIERRVSRNRRRQNIPTVAENVQQTTVRVDSHRDDHARDAPVRVGIRKERPGIAA